MSAVQTIAVPPHNLEAEKSVLGAVLLDERHLHALLVEQHLRPEHFYREQHGAVFAAMMELYESDRKIDHLTVAETLRQRGKLEEIGGPAAIDELAGWVPAAGHAREYGQIVRDNAQLRALLTTSYEIQASVMSREAPPRDLVERAERSVLEVAHDDRQKKFRPIAEILDEETDKLHRLSIAQDAADRHAVGLQGPRRADRRLSARQPDRDRRAAVDGEVGAGRQHRRERRARSGHPSTGRARSRCSRSRCPSPSSRSGSSPPRHGSAARSCARAGCAENRWPKILAACQRLSERAAVDRRLERHRRARGPRQGPPPAPPARRRASA